MNESRAQRRRSIVHGKVRMREVATRFWLLTFVGLAVFGVAYWKYSQVELEGRKQGLRARQRAVREALGSRAPELLTKVEKWTRQLAEEEPLTIVVEPINWEKLVAGPVLYVRIDINGAMSLERLEKAAGGSLRDGFTSCLLPTQKGASTEVKCKQTSQCEPGLRCAREGVCREPDAPFNFSYLTDGLRVSSDRWLQALAETNNEFEVRAMELELEDDAKHAVPMAVEVAKRSRYFLAVVDEPLPEDAPRVPGLRESSQQRLQAVTHWVRVGVWDIARGKRLAALRLEAGGEFVNMGRGADPAAEDAALRRARQRQVNNCSLAVDVREALGGAAAVAATP